MKRNLAFLMTLLVLLSLLLAACGGGDTAGDTADEPAAPPVEDVVEEVPAEAPAEAPTEAPAEEPAEAPTEEAAPADADMAAGGLLIWADEARATVLEPIVANFEEEFGVPVDIQQLQFGDIRDQFKIAGPAGEGPDIILGAHDWLGELVINGLLAPIDLGDKRDQFVENALDAFTFDGTLYGMPIQTENVALVRNTDLVPEAPTTWEEVEAACDAVADQVEVCFALQQGDPYHFFGIQSSYGGRVFGTTDEGTADPSQVEIDSEGSVAAAEYLGSLVEQGYVQAGTEGQVAEGLFDEGQAAFIITGPWAINRLNEAGVPYAISALPEGTEAGAPFLGVQGFMVSAFSEDALLAQTFLTEYVATEEIMSELVSADPRPSAFIPVREAQDDPALAGFSEAGQAAIPMPSIPEMSAVWSSWGDALTLIQTGEEDPATAFGNAAEQIRTTIEEGGSQ